MIELLLLLLLGLPTFGLGGLLVGVFTGAVLRRRYARWSQVVARGAVVVGAVLALCCVVAAGLTVHGFASGSPTAPLALLVIAAGAVTMPVAFAAGLGMALVGAYLGGSTIGALRGLREADRAAL